ncbi:MAG: MBL fold metallo-hydrolase [Paenibacillaceae bacterium]|nr:MBL fold metallo-hydrolase [Paenibacillaceae bacterium]
MIDIQPIASSSAGNAYLITDGTTMLLLEAGVRFRDIQRATGFRTSLISACLLTHEHLDHSRYAVDVMRAGIDVYASHGTLEAAGLTGHRAITFAALVPVKIGTWTILPFDVQHDVSEPYGFFLANAAGDKLLFATDTYYIRHRFAGLTHIMVECNYSQRILDDNVAAGRIDAGRRKRTMRSHFSLENVLEFLAANDLRRVEEIHLMHLSDANSDEAAFKLAVQAATGKPVYVAQR